MLYYQCIFEQNYLLEDYLDFMAEKNISVNGMDCIHAIFGNLDENINIIQREYKVAIFSRNGGIIVSGSEANVDAAAAVVDSLEKMYTVEKQLMTKA